MITISDVARVAGVSRATVSRVLNGNHAVDPGMAERVHAASRDLSYRPSRIARSLRTKRTSLWAVIISDIRNPFFTEMVRGVEDVAYANNYSLMLCNADSDVGKEADYLQLCVSEFMAGVILTPASQERSRVTPLLEADVPVVIVDRRLGTEQVDRVLVDNAGGASMAVEHLVNSGYRRIACVSGPTNVSTGAERLNGYMSGLRSRGISVSRELIRFGDFQEEGGKAAMQRLLAMPQRPEAVFVANNLMTLGALEAIGEAGMVIPDDIGVVGFDDPPWASLLRPPLTTIAQPAYNLGTQTARMLLDRIRGHTGSARELILAPTLQVRSSSQIRD